MQCSAMMSYTKTSETLLEEISEAIAGTYVEAADDSNCNLVNHILNDSLLMREKTNLFTCFGMNSRSSLASLWSGCCW